MPRVSFNWGAGKGNCEHDEPSRTVICDLVILGKGNNAQVIIGVDVISTTRGIITNTVTVTARQPDPNWSNNTAIEDTTVLQTDLAIIKTDFPDPVMAGQDLMYTLIVANNGPDIAPGVVITDTLPSEVTFVYANPSRGRCTETGGIVTCELGTLTDGATAVVRIGVTAPSAAVTVDKTMSLTETCPGSEHLPIGDIGDIEQPVTLCYEITNTGNTDLDTIMITDTVKTTSGPQVIFTGTETSATNPNLPLEPDESIIVAWALDGNILILCNDQAVVVTAEAVGTLNNTAIVAVRGNETDTNQNNSAHTTEETDVAGGSSGLRILLRRRVKALTGGCYYLPSTYTNVRPGFRSRMSGTM